MWLFWISCYFELKPISLGFALQWFTIGHVYFQTLTILKSFLLRVRNSRVQLCFFIAQYITNKTHAKSKKSLSYNNTAINTKERLMAWIYRSLLDKEKKYKNCLPLLALEHLIAGVVLPTLMLLLPQPFLHHNICC